MKPDRGALRYFGRIKNGTTPASGEAEYWDGDVKWATPEDLGRLTSDKISATKRMVTVKAVEECNLAVLPLGSVLISTRAPIGHMAINDEPMAFNQGCRGIIPGDRVHGPFLYYSLKSRATELNAKANGTTFVELSRDELASVPVQFPPLETQQRIARFLDEKTARIDGLIAKKRALLDRLAEKRQALITRVVTKGLNPDAPMKHSGIDWLGDVPAHWAVLPLKRRIIKMEQGWSPAADERTATGDEWGVLKSGCVNDGVYNESSHKALPSIIDPKPELEVRSGDILMCRASGSLKYIGSVALVQETRPRLMFSDKTYRVALDISSVDRSFFVYSMSSKHLRDQILLSVSGAEGLANNITQSSVGRYLHSFPPLAEQIEIASHLGRLDKWVENARALITTSVEQLKDYRSALITSAVSGQIPELQ